MKVFVVKATVEKIIRDLKGDDVKLLTDASSVRHAVENQAMASLLTNVIEAAKKDPEETAHAIANIAISVQTLCRLFKPAMRTTMADIEVIGKVLEDSEPIEALIARTKELLG